MKLIPLLGLLLAGVAAAQLSAPELRQVIETPEQFHPGVSDNDSTPFSKIPLQVYLWTSDDWSNGDLILFKNPKDKRQWLAGVTAELPTLFKDLELLATVTQDGKETHKTSNLYRITSGAFKDRYVMEVVSGPDAGTLFLQSEEFIEAVMQDNINTAALLDLPFGAAGLFSAQPEMFCNIKGVSCRPASALTAQMALKTAGGIAQAPLRLTLGAANLGSTILVAGNASLPDGTVLLWNVENETDTTDHRTLSGVTVVKEEGFEFTADLSGWKGKQLTVRVVFRTDLPNGQRQPEATLQLAGPSGSKLQGEHVVEGKESKYIEIIKVIDF